MIRDQIIQHLLEILGIALIINRRVQIRRFDLLSEFLSIRIILNHPPDDRYVLLSILSDQLAEPR